LDPDMGKIGCWVLGPGFWRTDLPFAESLPAPSTQYPAPSTYFSGGLVHVE
jgi:hypothetical protein